MRCARLLVTLTVILGLAGLATAATTTYNYGFEDGVAARWTTRDPMDTPPQVLTEANGNKFLRITTTKGTDCNSLPADYCAMGRTRSTVWMTSKPADMPLITNESWTYSARIRINNQSMPYASVFELFSDSPEPEPYGSNNGTGPSARVLRDDSNMNFENRYNNENSIASVLRSVTDQDWHTYKAVANWSHTVGQSSLEWYLDGVRVMNVTGRDVNIGPATNRIPGVKYGLYFSTCINTSGACTRTVDLDDLMTYPTLSGPPAPTGGATAGLDVTDPTTPGNPAAVANSDTQITVSWDASTDPGSPTTGVKTYRIDHCTTPGCTPTTQLALVNAPATTFVHPNLAPNSLHRYDVRAFDGASPPNESPQTAVVSATTPAAPPPPPVTGASIHVATNGSNTTGTGSVSQPYATIDRACVGIQAGDTVYVHGGTYTFTNQTDGIASCPGSGTSWDEPITVRSAPGEVVIFKRLPEAQGGPKGIPRFDAGSRPAVKYIKIIGGDRPETSDPTDRAWVFDMSGGSGGGVGGSADYIWLEGIEVKNCSCTSAVGVGNFGMMKNLSVHHNGSGGLSHGSYIHSSDFVVDGGHWFNNSGWNMHFYNAKDGGAGEKTCTPGRETASCPDCCGLINVTVKNVTSWNDEQGAGLRIYAQSGTENALIYNNVFHHSGVVGNAIRLDPPRSKIWHNTIYKGHIDIGGPSDNTIIQNNIIWNPSGGKDININSGAVGLTVDHNLILTGENLPAPLFVNVNANDYRLAAGSPAINVGVTLTAVPVDKLGAARPAGGAADVGAYEYGGVISCPSGDCEPPSVPTGLTASLVTSSSATLDWQDSTGGPALYRVYQCSVASGSPPCSPSLVVASPSASTYSPTGLTPGAAYTWTVASVDAAGNPSDQSAPVTLTMGTPVADLIAPSVPTGLSCTSTAPDRGTCTWTASTDNPGGSGVAGYRVRRLTGACGTPSVQVDTTAVPSYAHTGLNASTTYCVSVAAFDAASPTPNPSAYTSPVSFTTTAATPPAAKVVYLLDNNFNDSGGGGFTATNSGVTFTTTSAMRDEGSTHAGLWDSTSDQLTVPLATAGFTFPTNLTVALSFYPTNLTGTHFLFGHSATTPSYSNRVQAYLEGAKLGLGLGDSHTTNTDVRGGNLAANTLYRLWLRVASNGTYTADLAQDGTGLIAKAAGTFSGLSTLGATAEIGNTGTSQLGQGFLGAIDTVIVEQRVWTDTEVQADCAARVTSCPAPETPTYQPLDLLTCTQGDGVNAASNTTLRATLTGPTGPDPAACATLNHFAVAYGQVLEPTVACSITGTMLQLGLARAPALPSTPIGLTYTPTADQLACTNSTVPDLTTGADLQQTAWWCRRFGLGDDEPYEGVANRPCHVAPGGRINLTADLVNVGAADSPAQAYNLYCDDDPGVETDDPLDATPPVAIGTDAAASLGLYYHNAPTGGVHGAVRTLVLPKPAGITGVQAGVLKREPTATVAPVLAPNTATEYEHALAVAPSVPIGTCFYCEHRPQQSGAALSQVLKSEICVGPSRFRGR